jgi:hypothetical protein
MECNFLRSLADDDNNDKEQGDCKQVAEFSIFAPECHVMD